MNQIVPYSPHTAVHFDYSTTKPIAQKEILPDGTVIYPAVLSYTGIRHYEINGQMVPVLRSLEQVAAASHRRTMRMMTMTAHHPKTEVDGQVLPVWLDIYGTGEIDEYGCVHLPPSQFQIGQTGDTVDFKLFNGYTYPTGLISIKDPREAKNNAYQTSLGYFSLRMPPKPENMVDGWGIWNGPFGPERYLLEQVLDLEDARLQIDYLVGEGIAKDKSDAERIRDRIGANHLAKLYEGRGGPDVRIETDAKPITLFDLFSGYQDKYKGVYVCFDTEGAQKRLDTVELNLNNEQRINLTNLMRHKLTDLLPRISYLIDEVGVAEMPKAEMDVSPEIMEALKMAQAAIMETFENLKAKLSESEGGLKSAEEKALMSAKKAEGLGQENLNISSELDKLRAERDQAMEELAPIRRERIQKQIEEALLIGAFDASKASSFDSVEDAKRAVVYSKLPHLKDKNCSKDYIEARYHALAESFRDSLDTKEVEKPATKTEKFFGKHQDETPKTRPPHTMDVGKYELEQIYQAIH